MNFQKTYMSRAITRAMAVDHPVGDPFGGAAYGERNDPISAAISIGTMYATGTAMMAGSVMAGIAFAGAAVSLVGNVTGNKTLMQIGAIAGLAGGLGSMGAFGEAAKGATWGSLAGTSASTAGAANAANAANVASSTTPWGGSTVGTPPPGGSPFSSSYYGAGGGASAAAPAAAPIPAGPSVNAQGVPSPYGTNIAAGGVSPSSVSPVSVTDATSAANLGSATAQANDIVSMDQLGSQNFGLTPGGVGEQTFGQKMMGYGKEALDFAKTNPSGALMLGKAAGGLTDWLSGKTDAELDYIKAVAASKNAEQELYGVRADQLRSDIENEKKRRANLNAGYQQVNAGIAVNPNASIQQPWAQQSPGLINSARG
jgi:hypothetical protein